jgi:hypothetical protein
VVPQLVQDLVHLEGRQDGLDEHGGLDGAAGDAEGLLGGDEDVVPEARLGVVLELGQVEVRPGAPLQQRLRVVEDVQPEVEERTRDRLAVHQDVLLGQVPAPGAHQQGGGLVLQGVVLARLRRGVGDGAADGVEEVLLAADDVLPGGGVAVLEVGHEHRGPRVEGVDDHLAVDGAGDLDPAVEEVVRQGGHGPVAAPHGGGLGQEVGQLARVESGLHLAAGCQQLLPAGAEAPLQVGHEGQRLGREDGLRAGHVRPQDGDAGGGPGAGGDGGSGVGTGHGRTSGRTVGRTGHGW